MFSENPASVHIRDLKALKHDVILVLKPDSAEDKVPQWPEPVQVDVTDSYTFCRDCGTALGWLLAADVSEAHIRRRWRYLLEGENSFCNNLEVPSKQAFVEKLAQKVEQQVETEVHLELRSE